jgi:hypothetical protein
MEPGDGIEGRKVRITAIGTVEFKVRTVHIAC